MPVSKVVVGATVVCAGAVVVLGVVVSNHGTAGFDVPIATRAAALSSDHVAVFRFLTQLGASTTGLVLASAVGLLLSVRTRSPRPMAFLLATTVGVIVLNNLVKAVVERPRPEIAQIITPTGSSCRSGVRRARDRAVARSIAARPAGDVHRSGDDRHGGRVVPGAPRRPLVHGRRRRHGAGMGLVCALLDRGRTQ